MNTKEKNITSSVFRVPGEHATLLITVVVMATFGLYFSSINIVVFSFLLCVGVLYIILQQANYLGNAVRLHDGQFPRIYKTFKLYAETLGVSRANIYIKQDPNLNAITLGINKATVILNSALVEQLSEDELNFVIGHELGHFKARHTLISAFVNPLANNAFGRLLFGFWIRKTEYSCDRCALILTKDIDIAISALIKLSIGKTLYEEMNVSSYTSQIVAAESKMTSLSELLDDHPLITNRVKNLARFWNENFKRVK
jgi:Zn-dependent protease with chaperone function